MVVVDLGAGSGYHTFRMSPLVGETGKVIAVDIQKEMLEIIKQRMKRIMSKMLRQCWGKSAIPSSRITRSI